MSQPAPFPANEISFDLEAQVHLRRVVLREFVYGLRTLQQADAELVTDPTDEVEVAAVLEGSPVDGIELALRAHDTGLLVVARFERGEFVNLATAGLHMLDQADATEIPRGGEST